MAKNKSLVKITDEIIINKIIVIRDKKVMIDRDLAELYGVTTKRLNKQVKRNSKRFPADFMFQITKEEKEEIILQYLDELLEKKENSKPRKRIGFIIPKKR